MVYKACFWQEDLSEDTTGELKSSMYIKWAAEREYYLVGIMGITGSSAVIRVEGSAGRLLISNSKRQTFSTPFHYDTWYNYSCVEGRVSSGYDIRLSRMRRLRRKERTRSLGPDLERLAILRVNAK